MLVEDTALLYADLHPLDAEYARGQRSWLAGQAADMTGGTVEIRAEGMLLRLPEDRLSTSAVTSCVPGRDRCGAGSPSRFSTPAPPKAARRVRPDHAQRRAGRGVTERVYTDNFGALTMEIKESPARLRSVVERILVGLGLIRMTGDGWIILPVAARYRDPKAYGNRRWRASRDRRVRPHIVAGHASYGAACPRPPRTERWQPLRAGVVNLWEYDAAEVWYADGRLQLQGANESGKSTLMTLTTLLLIAGDISSHNIDTLGQSEKRFRYYVEPTDHALDRRDATQAKNRGWAWLEFGSVGKGAGGAEYFTLLLFAESRRADGALKVQWCTAHGPARVRDGLALAKAGVVAEPGAVP